MPSVEDARQEGTLLTRNTFHWRKGHYQQRWVVRGIEDRHTTWAGMVPHVVLERLDDNSRAQPPGTKMRWWVRAFDSMTRDGYWHVIQPPGRAQS